MADNDLDKYLEDIGINVDGEEAPSLPEAEDYDEPVVEVVAANDVKTDGSFKERAESFLVNLLLNFDPSYAVEVREREDGELYVDIFGGDPAKIIGRNGRTLQSLEYLTNAILNRQSDEGTRVTIDVGGYKRRRDDRLRETARKAAGRARETGQAQTLKPMNAAERRIIHVEVADDPSVISESTGEGRDRRVVVKPS